MYVWWFQVEAVASGQFTATVMQTNLSTTIGIHRQLTLPVPVPCPLQVVPVYLRFIKFAEFQLRVEGPPNPFTLANHVLNDHSSKVE